MSGFEAYRRQRPDDAGLDLMARTAAALRADAGFVAEDTDAAAALFLAEEPGQALAAQAFEQVMARIDAEAARDAAARAGAGDDPVRAEIARLPSPAREAALAALDHRQRWRFAGLGIRRLALNVPSGGHVELMRIEPGRGVVPHAHTGDEVTLVLEGGYGDGHAQYGPGDISLAQGDFTHAPKADPDGVCYVLAVSYGPPRIGGIFGLIERLSRRR